MRRQQIAILVIVVVVVGFLLFVTLAPHHERFQTEVLPMEWAIWVFVVVMLGLYLWSHLTAGREISKKLQPFVDDLFGVASSERDSKGKPPTKPKTD